MLTPSLNVPDFTAIAERTLCDAVIVGRTNRTDALTIAENIAEQLRLMWNARGAADLADMGPIIAKLADTMDPDNAKEFVADTIRSLDC